MIYRRPLLAGTVIFLISSVYLLSFCRYGINLWDEGGLYYGGIRYMDGQTVMKDFLGYPAGRYLLVEWVYRVWGVEMINLRWVIAILTGLLPLLTFQISRRFMPPVFAIAATLLSLSAPAVYYQRFYGFVFLFNAWAFILFLENRRNFFWLLAGAVLTYFFKVELLLFFIPVYCYLFWTSYGGKWKTPIALTAGVVLVLIFFQGKFGNQLYFQILNEYSLWGNPFPTLFEGYQGREFDLFAFLENILFYFPFITAAGTFAIGLKTKEKKRRHALLILAYLQLSALSLVVTRAGFDNLIRCLPLFFITSSVIVWYLTEKIPVARAKAAAEIAFLVLWVFIMVDFNVVNGFYTGSIGAKKEVNTRISEGMAEGIYAEKMDARIIEAVTNWVQSETKESDTIFTLPLNPVFYYLTGRRNPTSYDWVLPGTLKNSDEEKALVEQLNAGAPSLIILVNMVMDNRPERSLQNYAPLLVDWIVKNYKYSGRVAYFQVWKAED